jgi:DNA-binding response OmpR family regulator
MQIFRVLIIDDDQTSHLLYKSSLAKFPFVFDDAYTGEDGFVLIKKNQYDLVLLDVMMPKGTGIDLLREADSQNLSLPPVIMCSSMSDKRFIMKALSFGASGYLIKPVKPADLQKAVSDNMVIDPSLLIQIKSENVAGEPPATAGNVLNGQAVSLARAMSDMAMNRATGTITINTDEGDGTLTYAAGRLNHVLFNGKTGLEALETINRTKHRLVVIALG